MELRFKQVDVFTDKPFYGNPVAVVFDSDALTKEQMQKIAAWTNLSETTFIQSSKSGDYKLRIFTPVSELPFAGHPTIGSAFAAIEGGIIPNNKKEFIQECKAGKIRLTREEDEVFARVPRMKIIDKKINLDEFCDALGDAAFRDPIVIDAGPLWVIASLPNVNSLDDLKIDVAKTIELSKQLNVIGMTVYCIVLNKGVFVRTFAPVDNVLEDPVCGSGNAAVAKHIQIIGNQPLVGNQYNAYQGKALGRDGKIKVKYEGDEILIGGKAITVVDGKLNI